MRDVAIIGIGMQRFGELWETPLRSLCVNAARVALQDAGVNRVDSITVGCMSGGLFNGQEHLGNLAADYLGLAPAPATRVESACASGAAALRAGFMEVASGMSDIVLVIGVEKMTDISGDVSTDVLATAADQEYEAFYGATFPALNAMIARAYMERYRATSEELAAVAVKNHANGALNPLAQYRNTLTVQDVLKSPMVADPLRLLDCSPISDGAAAVVLCPLDQAARLCRTQPVRVAGVGAATDAMSLYRRPDLTRLIAVEHAGQQAYRMAGRTPKDIQVAEVHDAFTITEICAIEELGFVPRGQGARAAAQGLTALKGQIPINPSGGLKAKGHPVGATGVAQVYEIVSQLRAQGGPRQISGARIGLTQNMGGTGGSCFVFILESCQ